MAIENLQEGGTIVIGANSSVDGKVDITSITHPAYDALTYDWERFRCAFQGGQRFIERYLIKFSKRESESDFTERKKLTYVPGHARTAVLEIRNSIFQRMIDITRVGGPASYKKAVLGEGRGIDQNGTSMNSFMGTTVLPELMVMSRVGVYVDKAEQSLQSTIRDSVNNKPYIYKYNAEDIRSWAFDGDGELSSVLLRDHDFVHDDLTGLVIGSTTNFRLLKKVSKGVEVIFFDKDGNQTGFVFLDLSRIPFVIGEISESILTDVAGHQIALLNLASSDINYATKSNFPFYIEQYDPQAEITHMLMGQHSDPQNPKEGSQNAANTSGSKNISVGVTTGRGYAKGLSAPAFIAPSAEPLKASMAKQDEIKKEIRQLVSLSVTNLRGTNTDGNKSDQNSQGLEAGLAYLGLELEYMERRIAEIWSEYEGSTEIGTVQYPDNYSLRSEADRMAEAESLQAMLPKLPSATYKKALAKNIITITVGHKVSSSDLSKMHREIDKAEIVDIDPDVLDIDLENGLVSKKTASEARGYPKGDVAIAKIDKQEDAIAVKASQTAISPTEPINGAARGVDPLKADPKGAVQEKKASQADLTKIDGNDRTRGTDRKVGQRKRR